MTTDHDLVRAGLCCGCSHYWTTIPRRKKTYVHTLHTYIYIVKKSSPPHHPRPGTQIQGLECLLFGVPFFSRLHRLPMMMPWSLWDQVVDDNNAERMTCSVRVFYFLFKSTSSAAAAFWCNATTSAFVHSFIRLCGSRIRGGTKLQKSKMHMFMYISMYICS